MLSSLTSETLARKNIKKQRKACISFKSIIFVKKKHILPLLQSNNKTLTKKKKLFLSFSFFEDSIIASRPGGKRVYKFFVSLRDGKLGGWVVLDQSLWSHRKKNSRRYFCIIKEKIAYMECVFQSSMFYSFYLFSFYLFSFQMFELYSHVWIYIRMLKESAFSTCSWKMSSSDDVGKKISQ